MKIMKGKFILDIKYKVFMIPVSVIHLAESGKGRSMGRVVRMIAAVAVLAVAPGFAGAEEPSEPYVKVSLTLEGSLDAGIAAPGGFVIDSPQIIEIDESPLLDIQDGYWFPSAPNISAETEQARSGGLEIDENELSAELELELRGPEPLVISIGEIPHYATAGPDVIFIDDGEYKYIWDGARMGGEFQWLFSPNFGMFVEYRLLYPKVEFEDSVGAASADFETDRNSHSVLGGISFRF